MSGDPASWLVMEPGWTVLDANGEKVGKVKEVEGDLQTGIFHGIVVEQGLLGEDVEILSENVAEIHDGHVHLK